MQLHIASAETVDETYYTSAAAGGGREVRTLPLLRVPSEGLLGDDLAGVLFTGDLQGIAPVPSRGGATGLLGEAFVDRYLQLADAGAVPKASSVGVVLAGDLYSDPAGTKRGATGDVGPVWEAFASAFAWVVGVAGNHDLFTSRASRAVQRRSHVDLLDGEVVQRDGLTLGGVGGIVGRKGKVNRRELRAFVGALQGVVHREPDIVVVHEGPPGTARRQPGRPELADPLVDAVPLVVCGHVHWPEPLARRRGTIVLNVDGRAVLATRAGSDLGK